MRRYLFLFLLVNAISNHSFAGYLLQCHVVCKTCVGICHCDESLQKYYCEKRADDFLPADSNNILDGADPCWLCSKNPQQWPGACEMCFNGE